MLMDVLLSKMFMKFESNNNSMNIVNRNNSHKVLNIITVLILLLVTTNIYSQSNHSYIRSFKENKGASSSPFTKVSIGIGSILYLINPIILYEDNDIYAGITKELSVGFGKLGEHRAAFEYSFIFAGNVSSHVRLSYKYDFLMKDKLEPSHTLQTTSVLSVGGGYFTNFNKQGIFPEITYGYSLRNHKLLIYPHVKIRHTFMFKKDEADITDISFGIILGIANPFIDVKIKREY
jgi:hypothetical protein